MHLEENFFSTLGYMEYGTSKLYVYLFHIFPKMHLYYDNSQDKRENRNSKMEELFPYSLHTVQRLTRRWRSKRSCAVRSNPVDILSLTLPYLQSNFTVGGRPERLAINCLGLFEDIIRHYSLLPHRLSSKILGIILPKLKEIVRGCYRHFPCCITLTVHLLSSFTNCSKIDQQRNFLKLIGILTLSTVKAFFGKRGLSKSETGRIINFLVKMSDQVEQIYIERRGQHKLLFSSFLHVYNVLRQSSDTQLKGNYSNKKIAY